MVETTRNILELEDKGKTYLTEIFRGKWSIHNPTLLRILGLEEITATSMVLQRYHDGQIESYFTFNQKGTRGEIVRRDEQYYFIGQLVKQRA